MKELTYGHLVGDGRFRLERQLGEGGMGVVWLATKTATNERVALKFLTAGGAIRQDLRERLRREAKLTAAVDHPNVVKILEVIEEQGSIPVVVMEYLEGETLAERLDRAKPLPVDVAATLLLPVVSAVGTAHAAGIIHRDLKPENIFLVRGSDGNVEPHVLDFGLAKVLRHDVELARSNHTRTGAILGTPFYMSPEQASGEKGIDARADVWSMGVILYECLAGALPFTGDNFGQFFKNLLGGVTTPIASRRPGLPTDLADVIMRALTVDRQKRLPDLREIDEVLRKHTIVDAMPFSEAKPHDGRWSDPSLPLMTVVDELDGWEPTEPNRAMPAQASASSPLAKSDAPPTPSNAAHASALHDEGRRPQARGDAGRDGAGTLDDTLTAKLDVADARTADTARGAKYDAARAAEVLPVPARSASGSAGMSKSARIAWLAGFALAGVAGIALVAQSRAAKAPPAELPPSASMTTSHPALPPVSTGAGHATIEAPTEPRPSSAATIPARAASATAHSERHAATLPSAAPSSAPAAAASRTSASTKPNAAAAGSVSPVGSTNVKLNGGVAGAVPF